jgi:RNA polymerase sigma-70 factor (ECF subfamily)
MSQLVGDPTTDSAWVLKVVRDARAGSEEAFDTLFHYYNAQICTYLARMVGSDEEGRDLAQETFLKVWRALPGIHDESQFVGWLYRIATHTAIDHLRRRKFRWPFRKNHEEYNVMSIAGPEEQVVEAEQIKQVLAQIPPKYRACLLLQLVAGFTQREIAESLNLSEKSISIYVSRALEQFRQTYECLEHGSVATRRRRSTR